MYGLKLFCLKLKPATDKHCFKITLSSGIKVPGANHLVHVSQPFFSHQLEIASREKVIKLLKFRNIHTHFIH